MDSFKKLAEEISLEILTRLPTESVLDSKLVCTNWRKIISHHPLFSGKQLHHLNHPSSESSSKLGFLVSTFSRRYLVGLHYFEYDQNHHHQSTNPIQRITRINLTTQFQNFRLIGSSNGLICLLLSQTPIHTSVCICNPITREYLILPEIKRNCDSDGYDYEETCYGYVSSTNEYKVVGFYKLKTYLEVHIYTLGSGKGWRNLGKFNCGSSLDLKFKVFFANGSLYWLDGGLKTICSFDLAEEKFGEHLSPPPLPPDGDWYHSSIGVLDGFLVFALGDEEGGFSDIWLWKKKNFNNDKEEREEHQSFGWSKEFRIKKMGLLAVTKSDGVFTRNGNYLNIYDTKTSTAKSHVKFNSYILQVLPHRNTLVSVRESGEEDVKLMEVAEMGETKSREQLQEDADPEYIYL